MSQITPYTDAETIAESQVACDGLRRDLLSCLLMSDCCMKERLRPKECLRRGRTPNVPEKCWQLYELFMQCKRGGMDNRTRFRGRKGY